MSFLTTLKNIFGFKSGPKGALGPGDRYLVCMDCSDKFVFDAGEQRFFKTKGFTDPKRCPVCRKKVRSQMRKKFRRGGGGGGGGGRGRGGEHNFSRRDRGDSLIDGNSPYADER